VRRCMSLRAPAATLASSRLLVGQHCLMQSKMGSSMPPIAGNNHHCHRAAASPMVTREKLLISGTPRPVKSMSRSEAQICMREIGRGRTTIVLHGGPDFDQSYLLPEMDRLADGFRLIYYDQRGRGKSAAGVQPDDIPLASEIADLDKVRQYFKLDSMALLGHSWSTVLALEYATQYPEQVSHVI